MIVRELVAKFGFNVDKSGLDRADAAIGKTKKNSLDLGKIAGGAMAALGAMGVKQKIDESVDAANSFGEAMGKIQSLIPGNVARADEYSAAIKRLALEFGTTSADVAAGTYDVLSTFGDTADSIDQVSIAVKAGAAANATTKDGLALLGAVTKAYGDTSAATMQKVSDLGFQTVNLGNVELPELAASIGQVTPLASNLGVKMEEVFAVMASASGVTGSGSEVMTQMASAMQALLNKTPAMKKAYARVFGKELLKDAIGKDGVVGVFKKLAGTTDGSVESIQKLFGRVEGLKLILQLTGNGAKDFTDKMAAMGNVAGATDTAFAAMKGGLAANATEAAKTAEAMAQFKIKVGDQLTGPMNDAEAAVLHVATAIGNDLILSFQNLNNQDIKTDKLDDLGISLHVIASGLIAIAETGDLALCVMRTTGTAWGTLGGLGANTLLHGGKGNMNALKMSGSAFSDIWKGQAARAAQRGRTIFDPTSERDLLENSKQMGKWRDKAKQQQKAMEEERKQAKIDSGVSMDNLLKGGSGVAASMIGSANITMNMTLPTGTPTDQAGMIYAELSKKIVEANRGNAPRTKRSGVDGASNAGTNTLGAEQ